MEAITQPMFGENLPRIRRLKLGLLPQLIHEHSQVFDLLSVIGSSDSLQSLALGQRNTGVQISLPLITSFRFGRLISIRPTLTTVPLASRVNDTDGRFPGRLRRHVDIKHGKVELPDALVPRGDVVDWMRETCSQGAPSLPRS
jgi:hypothetical protein